MSCFVLKTIKENGFLEIRVNLRNVKSINHFITKMTEGFDFPNYFGGNSSSLDDCMRDLSWFDEDNIFIQFQYLESLKEKSLDLYNFVYHSLNLYKEYWQEQTDRKIEINF